LLANNRSFGEDRGYLNYLNWVAASTGGSWPISARRHITPTDSSHNFAGAYRESRSCLKRARIQKPASSAGLADWCSAPLIELQVNEYVTLCKKYEKEKASASYRFFVEINAKRFLHLCD
jgi:hypothetical protein